MRGLKRHGCHAALIAAAMVLVCAATARADAWRPTGIACYSASGLNGQCETVRRGAGLWDVAVAPGGRQAYGISYDDSALLIFDRDPSTGRLTQRGAGGCLSEDGSGGQCVKAKGISHPLKILVSPDGNNVYVGAGIPGGVATFNRNTTTGDLTQDPSLAGCITNDGSSGGVAGQCQDGHGLGSAWQLAIPSAGDWVYVGGDGGLSALKRGAAGVLTQAGGTEGCVTVGGADNCTGGPALGGALQITVSPDGRNLYVPTAANNDRIYIFDLNRTTGAINQKPGYQGCIGVDFVLNGCAEDRHLFDPRGAIVSPDGRQVYVTVIDGILTYGRAADGTLQLQGCTIDSGQLPCSRGRNLHLLSFMDISPDGTALVASLTDTFPDSGFVLFDRNTQSGSLSQLPGIDGCVTVTGQAYMRNSFVNGGCILHPAAYDYGHITWADDNNLYVGSYRSGGAITSFKRDYYPVCGDTTVQITANAPANLPFSCSDRNGDPMSYEITANPGHGLLGAISGASVLYSPFGGFTGGDSIRYHANSGLLSSQDATLTTSVVAPPPTGPPPAPRRTPTVTSPIKYNWSVKGSRLTITQLVVRSLPVGSKVTLKCKGKRCPFKSKSIKRGKSSTMNVLKQKTMRHKRVFRAKQTLDVVVSAPNMHTKVLRFRMRSNVVPTGVGYCIPLGKKKLQKTC